LQETKSFDIYNRIGNPDYILMFTDVVSHKLINTTLAVSKKKDIPNILGVTCKN